MFTFWKHSNFFQHSFALLKQFFVPSINTYKLYNKLIYGKVKPFITSSILCGQGGNVCPKKHLKSKVREDEDCKDSCIEDRDDKEVGRREDLQRFLGNIPFMFINNQIIVA